MGAFQRKCEICGAEDWEIVYTGYIRDGSFGNLTPEPCRVARCRCCGVERLDEKDCKQKSFYEEREYRRLLSEPVDGAGFAQKHDILQLGRLQVLWPETFRQKVVADVGCAGGSFLDHVSGLAARSIAIEPCRLYHNDLEAKGYSVYSYTQDALQQETVSVDLAFTFSVIEHTRNPLDFLCQIRKLLKNDGKLWVSTPNRREILMDLLGPDYHRFFLSLGSSVVF
jgi:2-polyprenyl-3-methyl-5-hydroxy-6-metoxy-1,4-benzoquinol methylase